MGCVVSITPRPPLLPGKTRYPLYRRLGGPRNRSGQVRKISPHRDSVPGPSSPQRVAIPTTLSLLWGCKVFGKNSYVMPCPPRELCTCVTHREYSALTLEKPFTNDVGGNNCCLFVNNTEHLTNLCRQNAELLVLNLSVHWSLTLQDPVITLLPSLMYKNCAFRAHSILLCIVSISEQTEILSLCGIK